MLLFREINHESLMKIVVLSPINIDSLTHSQPDQTLIKHDPQRLLLELIPLSHNIHA